MHTFYCATSPIFCAVFMCLYFYALYHIFLIRKTSVITNRWHSSVHLTHQLHMSLWNRHDRWFSVLSSYMLMYVKSALKQYVNACQIHECSGTALRKPFRLQEQCCAFSVWYKLIKSIKEAKTGLRSSLVPHAVLLMPLYIWPMKCTLMISEHW